MGQSSRLLRPTSPGGLLSKSEGEMTASEELVLQAIEDGSYFVENETPTPAPDGSTTDFTLAGTPNPAESLNVFVNGQKMTLAEDYTLTGAVITFVAASIPQSGDKLRAEYRISPV